MQIGYTTIVARYYRRIEPRALVDGARTGIAAELVARGIDARLPYTPAHVDLYGGGDAIDAMVLRTLARYGARVSGHALVTAALSGELAALDDPYSVLLRPKAFKTFNAFLGSAPIGGIGAVVSVDATTNEPTIDRTLPDSPAAAVGLRGGDAIVAIDGHATRGLDGASLLQRLRGAIGSRVRIDVERAGTTTSYELVRAAIRDPEVVEKRFGSVGYLGLARFGDRAGSDVADDLRDLQSHGATGFVLDLRNNGGGYGDEATAVASALGLRGTIFTTRERNGATTVARATGNAPPATPLAVLVDGDTASAAEIVAGAVQDDRAGTIVGTKTFGKGVAQSVFPLPDGSAFKLTTARYTTPNGRDIEGTGIAPDVVVKEPPGSTLGDPATDPQLAAAMAALDSR